VSAPIQPGIILAPHASRLSPAISPLPPPWAPSARSVSSEIEITVRADFVEAFVLGGVWGGDNEFGCRLGLVGDLTERRDEMSSDSLDSVSVGSIIIASETTNGK